MQQSKELKLLPIFSGVFVACLLIANVAAAAKLIQVGPFMLTGGIIVFPISYIFGDILTEVYGYARSRKVIWTGFGAMLLASGTFLLLKHLPAPTFWQNQEAYDSILGFAPRIFLASIVGYFSGEFCNSFVLSKMKYWASGARGLSQVWRFVASTIVGEGADTVIFTITAFVGTLGLSEMALVAFSGYIFKVAYEIIATPLSTRFANWVKKIENIDVVDIPQKTNYNPFIFAPHESASIQ